MIQEGSPPESNPSMFWQMAAQQLHMSFDLYPLPRLMQVSVDQGGTNVTDPNPSRNRLKCWCWKQEESGGFQVLEVVPEKDPHLGKVLLTENE
jgi:hypothetical protein